jgi:hypothetical protein
MGEIVEITSRRRILPLNAARKNLPARQWYEKAAAGGLPP